MSTILDLDIVQLGTETTWGSDETPTVKLMSVETCSITPIRTSTMVGEKRGSLAPGFAHIRTIEEGAASLAGLLTYQDADYLFQALFGVATPTTDANGTLTRVYSAPGLNYATDLAAPASYTLVYGNPSSDFGAGTDDVYALLGSTLTTLQISGGTGAPLRYTASFVGKQVAADAFADLDDRAVEHVMGDHVVISLDPASDTVGTTPLTNLAFSFTLDINTNRALVRHLNSLTPDKYKEGVKWDGTMALSFEFASDASAELSNIMTLHAGQEKAIRIKASTGATSTARQVQLDFTGVILAAPTLFTYQDGIRTLDLQLAGIYSSVRGNWLEVETLSNVATLA